MNTDFSLNTSTARQECATLSLYTTSRTTDTAPMLLSFAGCKNSTALTSLHCSIRSRVEVNFVNVCGFNARRGSPELQQVCLPVRFSRRRFRFSLRKALNTSDFFGFRFFGFHFKYGLTTDETYSRRQINTGTKKFEVSHLHNIFVDIGQSGLFMDY